MNEQRDARFASRDFLRSLRSIRIEAEQCPIQTGDETWKYIYIYFSPARGTPRRKQLRITPMGNEHWFLVARNALLRKASFVVAPRSRHDGRRAIAIANGNPSMILWEFPDSPFPFSPPARPPPSAYDRHQRHHRRQDERRRPSCIRA